MRQIIKRIGRALAETALFPVLLLSALGSTLVLTPSASAQNLAYTITYDALAGKARVRSSHYGEWDSVPFGMWGALRLISTGPGTTQPPGTRRHVIEFDFMSPDYFGAGGGHFAIFARADLYTVTIDPNYPFRGHGVILGDVSAYPNFQHPNGYACSRTPARNQIAIEAAGAVQRDAVLNCVFGQETNSGIALANNAWYRLRLVSDYVNDNYQTTYTLYLPSYVGWLPYVERTKVYAYPQLPSNLGGWFFAEVFNRSGNWTLHLSNLNARWE